MGNATPSPTCPEFPWPQPSTVPSPRRAMLCPACDAHGIDALQAGAPPSTEMAPVRVPVPDVPVTCTGVRLHALDTEAQFEGPVWLLIPSSPESFRPHATTLVSGRIARLWRAPAANAVAPR